jgi:2-polyprenyl-6-methoxyphenol hydroxylase-like FAD-dependent oxidoreductase
MRRLVILGAGTAGTMVANKLQRRLPSREWLTTVVDRLIIDLVCPGGQQSSGLLEVARQRVLFGLRAMVGAGQPSIGVESHADR